jgi:glycosyltransferase involved in cell wall biosynthesis
MILKGFPRISETFISNEIGLLEEIGFAVRLFSMRQPRENFVHQSVHRIRARVDYLPETLLRPLPTLLRHNAQLAVRDPRRYAGALGTAAGRFRRTRRLATLKHLLQAGYLVQRFLPGSGVAHLHAHFAHSPTSVALFASRLSGLPFSFTAHAKDIYTADPDQLREKIALSRFVVTCTEYNRGYLAERCPACRHRIHRIYHGIDTSLFSAGRPARTPTPPYHVLTVARLTPKKGLPTVLRALALLTARGVKVTHTLIGDGEDRERVRSLITALGLSRVTRWIGTQAHERVLDHYRQADLFVLGCEVAPNGDRDGIPNVFLESLAMGVPVVGTRVSSIPELVEDGRTGLLVPPGDPAAMAGAMQRLLTDTGFRDRIIAAGRRRVLEEFDNRRLIGQLAALFQAMLGAVNPSAQAG